MRFARIMLRVQLACMAVGAVAVVYVLGFGVHPHQVGYACVVAACYVIFTGIATFFMQKAWRAQARSADAAASIHADDGATPDIAALGPRDVRHVRSLRRAWLSMVLLGVAMLVAFVVLVNHYEGSATTLESSGAHVQGVVTSVIAQGEAPFDGSIDVEYVYAGQSFDAHIYRDDNSPFYHVGEAVTVTVDPSDPQVATVGSSDNQGPGMVLLLVVLLLLGGALVFLGLALLFGLWLTGRRARRAGAFLTDHLA
jgi:Protein of unknown function (DUF3592)